jgi:hypothetical protein
MVRLAMSKERANDKADGDPHFPRRSTTPEPKVTQSMENLFCSNKKGVRSRVRKVCSRQEFEWADTRKPKCLPLEPPLPRQGSLERRTLVLGALQQGERSVDDSHPPM